MYTYLKNVYICVNQLKLLTMNVNKRIVLITCCVTVIPIFILILFAVMHISLNGEFDETVLSNLLNED